MTIYVTHYLARNTASTASYARYEFNKYHGNSCGLDGHYIEGRGVPLDVAQRIVTFWTRRSGGAQEYTLHQPRDEEL